MANSGCRFADLNAKIFVSGCHGNHACWEKNKVEYFDNVTTLTCSESLMKTRDHECPAPFKIFWFLSGIALKDGLKEKGHFFLLSNFFSLLLILKE